MDTKPFKKVINLETEIIDINEEHENLIKMSAHFKISMLQASLDYMDKSNDELKVIVLDKLLRLNFPDSYIAFYRNNSNILTIDEKEYINDPLTLNRLIFVKINLQEAEFIYEIKTNDSSYYLILKDEKYVSLQLRFIKWGLSQNE